MKEDKNPTVYCRGYEDGLQSALDTIEKLRTHIRYSRNRVHPIEAYCVVQNAFDDLEQLLIKILEKGKCERK